MLSGGFLELQFQFPVNPVPGCLELAQERGHAGQGSIPLQDLWSSRDLFKQHQRGSFTLAKFSAGPVFVVAGPAGGGGQAALLCLKGVLELLELEMAEHFSFLLFLSHQIQMRGFLSQVCCSCL